MNSNLFSFVLIVGFLFSRFVSGSGKNDLQEIIICRGCGADVADSNYIIHHPSPGSVKTRKKSLFGKKYVTVQSLVNPMGIHFEVLTVEKSRCVNVGPRYAADSWFPEHTWRICLCPQCGKQLGWTFESLEGVKPSSIFDGLILAHLLSENFTESLLLMPNSYKM